MLRVTKILSVAIATMVWLTLISSDCEGDVTTSKSGVTEKKIEVQTDIDGYTVEQRNIANRLTEDNKPGSIKHLYIISSYSGQVLLYSTVKGKVTSSGKRLTPTTRIMSGGSYVEKDYADVIQDDGTFGNSIEYIYWWDSKGIYHQQYIAGGMMVHISNQPIAVKSVVINLEMTKQDD